ncbi:hypothetical protein C8J56DRAFT_910397 [Mycena floridula]|nr:hypothetical protein C8J56DRAFT_910397 [Mycena floridula]
MPFLDDRDPAIQYSAVPGDWVPGGVSSEFRFTTQGSRQRNARATITFEGNAITVYGTIQSIGSSPTGTQGPVSAYTIDGGAPATFSGVPGASDLYQQTFFASPPLSQRNHTLLVENTIDGPILVIDYVQYTSSIDIPLGAMIGAVLGAVVFTILCCIAILYFMRRRDTKQKLAQSEVTPFVGASSNVYASSIAMNNVNHRQHNSPSDAISSPDRRHQLAEATPPPYDPPSVSASKGFIPLIIGIHDARLLMEFSKITVRVGSAEKCQGGQ